jgi:YbbR domain-containing protein
VAIDSLCFPGDTTLSVYDAVPKGFSFDIITNPADKHTSLRITLAKAGNISVTTSDALGREILQTSHILSAGITELPLDISDLAEGSYFVIVEINGERLVQSLKIVR